MGVIAVDVITVQPKMFEGFLGESIVSRAAKKSANDSDRLTKYLARFGLKFREIAKA